MREAIEFRILGPVEVLVDGRLVPVGASKQRALLATLLLESNRVVPAGRLIEALWGEEPPPTAAKTLQVHVSRLRRDLSLGEDGPLPRIRTSPPGYVLELSEEALDLARFERLLQEGRDRLAGGDAEQASQALRAALDIWRGPPLADLALEPAAALVAPHLEEQRLAALEDRIDADLALGRHHELVGELRQLVAGEPLRERLVAQLMLALYRSGRQGDALSAYQAARQALASELGLEPGPRLKALEHRILNHDTALDVPEPPRRPPSVLRRRPPVPRAAAAAGALIVVLVAAGLVLGGSRGAGGDAAEPAADRIRPDRLVRVDARTGRATVVARVGRHPDQLVVTGGEAWVANGGDRSVSRIHLASGTTQLVRGFPAVDRVASDPLGAIYVSSQSRFVWHVPPATMVPRRVLDLRGPAEALAFGAGSLWIASPAGERGAGADRVLRYDGRTARVAQRVRVGATPLFMSFGYGRLWVSNYDGDSISIVRPGRRRAETVLVGDGPLGIAAGEGAVWVVHYGDRRLWRIHPISRQVVARIPVGAGPLTVAAGEGYVWVTNREDGTVLQVDPATNRVRRTVRLDGVQPYGVAVGHGAAWVTVQGAHPSGA